MLAEYSQWPFGRRAGGQAAMGANLDAVIREEIGGSQERELQMEVCFLERYLILTDIMLTRSTLQVVAACLGVFTRLDSLL
jgi:Golgi phosphoprotein 3